MSVLEVPNSTMTLTEAEDEKLKKALKNGSVHCVSHAQPIISFCS